MNQVDHPRCSKCGDKPISIGSGFSILCKDCTIEKYNAMIQFINRGSCHNALCQGKLLPVSRYNSILVAKQPCYFISPPTKMYISPYCAYCMVNPTQIEYNPQYETMLIPSSLTTGGEEKNLLTNQVHHSKDFMRKPIMLPLKKTNERYIPRSYVPKQPHPYVEYEIPCGTVDPSNKDSPKIKVDDALIDQLKQKILGPLITSRGTKILGPLVTSRGTRVDVCEYKETNEDTILKMDDKEMERLSNEIRSYRSSNLNNVVTDGNYNINNKYPQRLNEFDKIRKGEQNNNYTH